MKIMHRYLFGLKINRKMLFCVAYQPIINVGYVEDGMNDVHRLKMSSTLTMDEIPNTEPDFQVLIEEF